MATNTSPAKKAAAKKSSQATAARKSTTTTAKKAPAKTAAKKGSVKHAAGANNDALLKVVSSAGAQSSRIPVDLVGQRYRIHRPKAYAAMQMARVMTQFGGVNDTDDMDDEEGAKFVASLVESIDEWIDRLFREDADAIRERLNDSEDELDMDHLMDLMTQVSELVSVDPTT